MPGESRDELLARIRDALGGRSAEEPLPPALDAGLIRTNARPDLVGTFIERATAAGTLAQQVSADELGEVLRPLLAGARRASLGFVDEELRALVEEVLRSAGVEIVVASSGIDPHFDSDIGLTDVEAAIAETGTLVYVSGAARPRAACFVPPVHVALVRSDQIVADLVDYLAARPLPVPSSELLITGPSKTADIEGTLVKGVHGPGEVRALVLASHVST